MRSLKILLVLLTIGVAGAFIDPGFPTGDPFEIPDAIYSRENGAMTGRTPGLDGATFYYPPEPVFISGKTAEELDRNCRAFVDDNPEIFEISSDDLELQRAENRLGRWWITYSQTQNGIPAEGGRVDFRIFGNGRLAFSSSRIIPAFDGATPAIDQSRAVSIARNNYLKHGSVENVSIVFWPDFDEMLTIGRLAWRIDLVGNPGEKWRCYISAIDGAPLFHYSLINYYDVWGTGYIEYLPRYWDDTFEVAEFQYGNVNLNYFHNGRTDVIGQYMLSTILSWEMPIKAYLKGEWTEVINNVGDDGVYQEWLSPPKEHNFIFDMSWADSAQINLYYHTTYIHEYYEELDPPLTALDYPVPAKAGIPGTTENAFWDGYSTNYGVGGMSTRNFALFSNIIYHEYTHGITGWMYEGTHFPYSGQSGAMNESFSDYFACTNNDGPRVGYKCQRTGSQMFRTMDNTYQYPRDWQGQVHADGRIMGGAFWDLRERIEVGRCDTLIHFTRYATPNTFHGFVPECIFTDDDDDDLTNGTPNYFEILESFSMHGIGPGVFPNFTSSYEMIDIGDGDGYLEGGEELRITPEIIADDSFSWPNIEGLRAVLRLTGSETVTIVDSTSSFATNIAPGDLSIGDDFAIQAPVGFIPHMAELYITYYADNSPFIVADTFEIYVGYPQLLLVDDDPDTFSQVASYYIEALEELGVTYLYHRTLTKGRPTDMNDFPAMLWFTGSDTFSRAISDSDTAAISEFFDGGGHVILTGQNMTGQFAPSFLSSRFGAIHYSTGASVLVNSLDNPWLDFEGENLILIGAPGAGNQRPERLTTLTPISAEPIFEYSGGDIAAVASNNGTNKTALFGFGLEGLGGTTYMHLPELLQKLFRWFDLQFVSIDEKVNIPENFTINVYPNPFNASCRIRTGKGAEVIEIFDITGRLVDRLQPDPAGITSWKPDDNIPGGIYLIRAHSAGRRVSAKAVLLR